MTTHPTPADLRAEYAEHLAATRVIREPDRGHSIPAITSALYRAGVSADVVDTVMLELGVDHGPVDRERCRTSRRITYRGETLTIGGWADRLGMSEWTLRHRLRAGWPVEEALGTPARVAGARTYSRPKSGGR